MARRSKQGDPQSLRQRLVEHLQAYETHLKSGDLRRQVKQLVPVYNDMRDLGGSLMEEPDAKSGRARILAYFRKFIGEVLEGGELMIVAGIDDYARRIRELRVEHGWQIISGNTLREILQDNPDDRSIKEFGLKPDQYILLKIEPDHEAASRWKIAKTIRNDKELTSGSKKILAYLRHYVGQPVSGDELKYVVKDDKEWARRTRELRTEDGWPIVTKVTGRPELPIGSYLLEEDRQAPEHDRKIKDNVRGEVLQRDNYKCVDCGWSRDAWHRDDPRNHLELHHTVMHSKGGANTSDNLITLCNVCHDERHRKEKSA